MLKKIMCFCLLSIYICAQPPKKPPPELIDDYTLNGRIPILYQYYNNTSQKRPPKVFKSQQIAEFIADAKARKSRYYGKTDGYLYAALDKYSNEIAGKQVAIIGSTVPWYESIVLAYGGFPVVIEYNKINNEVPEIEVLTVEEFTANPRKFDVVFSISSFEHDGLGRYGDPLNPNGDLDAMQSVKEMLNEDGLLFLSVPVAHDVIVWNAHRIYGKIRLPMLLKGWSILDTYGFSQKDFTQKVYRDTRNQPVFVLKKET